MGRELSITKLHRDQGIQDGHASLCAGDHVTDSCACFHPILESVRRLDRIQKAYTLFMNYRVCVCSLEMNINCFSLTSPPCLI